MIGRIRCGSFYQNPIGGLICICRMMEEKNETRERAVCDYIAGMTDIYAIDRFEELFVPQAWKV